MSLWLNKYGAVAFSADRSKARLIYILIEAIRFGGLLYFYAFEHTMVELKKIGAMHQSFFVFIISSIVSPNVSISKSERSRSMRYTSKK